MVVETEGVERLEQQSDTGRSGVGGGGGLTFIHLIYDTLTSGG